MARAMNVGKRQYTLKDLLKRTARYSERAAEIAKEIRSSFKGSKGPAAKNALKLAASAEKAAKSLAAAAKSVTV